MGTEIKLSASARQQLNRFSRQYFQLHLELDYPDEELLRSDAFQQSLFARLFSEKEIKYTPPARYRIRVLKELTKRIEQSIQDWEEEGIFDDLMNYLSSLLVSSLPSEIASAQQKSYVTYALSSLSSQGAPVITLLEARNMLAASGTTGFRTWEAALHLGNYLCANRASLVQGKSVLELGAGTGYISVLCAKHLGASHVIATDGSDDVVNSLSTNFYLNGLQDCSLIEGKELKWGQALVGGEHPKWNRGRNIDIVLGADLTYDGSGIPALVSTFDDLFELYPKLKILYAATVRNPKTFEKFLDTCRAREYMIEEMKFEINKVGIQEGPFYSDQVPIQLCSIRRS